MKFLDSKNWTKVHKPNNQQSSYSRTIQGVVGNIPIRLVMGHGNPLNLTFKILGSNTVKNKGGKKSEQKFLELPYSDDNALKKLYEDLLQVIQDEDDRKAEELKAQRLLEDDARLLEDDARRELASQLLKDIS